MEVTVGRSKLHVVLVTKYYSSDQIKAEEMGGACCTLRKMNTSLWWKNLQERGRLGLLRVDVNITVK
jgi:hypothetical protein